MMDKSKFSLVLRKYRENANLTQKQVAEALGIERSTYAYYEMGATSPSGSMILKLSNILGIDYTVFMDAVADQEFDRNPEDLSFTTLHDRSAEEREQIYTLKKNEQNLVLLYRTLDPEQKKTIDDLMEKYRKENFGEIQNK